MQCNYHKKDCQAQSCFCAAHSTEVMRDYRLYGGGWAGARPNARASRQNGHHPSDSPPHS